MPKGSKLGKMKTYHERLPPIKSYYPFSTWSSETMGQTKPIKSPLLQCL